MYVPEHFAADDPERVAAFVDQAGAADLVTFDGVRPVASLLPVIWDRSAGEQGTLLGHMALANPQWSSAAPGISALAIVHGPQAYVSPSWYQSTKSSCQAVPTWNYTAVHFTGPVTFHRDEEWLREIVTRLTERYEAGRPDRWRVSHPPERYIAGMLRAIVGFEMYVTRVDAKDKLSQNRPEQDRAAVIAALGREPGAGGRQIADLMRAGAAQSSPGSAAVASYSRPSVSTSPDDGSI